MFGQNKTTQSGFTFGAATTSASAGTGFTFGAPTSAAATGLGGSTTGSGFTFGAQTTQPSTQAQGLSFGASTFGSATSSATSTSQTTGFTLGTASQPQATGAGTTAGTVKFAASPFSFGGQSTSTAPTLGGTALGTQATSTTGTSGFTFGATAAQPAAATSQPAGSLFGGIKPAGDATATGTALKFGLAATSTQATTNAAQTTTTASTGLAFGQLSTAAGQQPTKPLTLLGATSQPASTASSAFGSLTAKTATTVQQAKTTASAAAAVQPTSSTTSTATEKPFTYKQLEDIINKWVLELEDQEALFLNQAKQINTWDRLLIENGEKITTLNDEMERLKTDQSRLDRELDFILSQQQELEEILNPLEQQIKAQQNVPYMQHADLEREKTYKMAENIDTQLKRMMQDIKDIINHINTSNTNLKDNEDPMAQIAKILNSHMDSLQWVDQNAVLLQRKVEDVSKQVESRRREHERSLRLTFD